MDPTDITAIITGPTRRAIGEVRRELAIAEDHIHARVRALADKEAQVNRLDASLVTARNVLVNIEWGSLTANGPACPWCKAYREDGTHEAGCALAEIIKRTP